MKIVIAFFGLLCLPVFGDLIVKTETGFSQISSLDEASTGEVYIGKFIDVTTGPLPNNALKITEVRPYAIQLQWEDLMKWQYPWLIQRSMTGTFLDPVIMQNHQATDNTGQTTFRWLGINATNYRDLDEIAPNTTYYYRVGVCVNLQDHYSKKVPPVFSNWLYAKVTTGALPSGQTRYYDVTKYGAIAGDGKNDYPAALKAYSAAKQAGGGMIYWPDAGQYDLWPIDAAVTLTNGQLVAQKGQPVTTVLFRIDSDNICFIGDPSRTSIKLYLWHKQPATQWLSIQSNGAEVGVQRYHLFLTSNVENFNVKNLSIDMGAVPVQTGKQWYTLDDRRYQWDISHKFLASFDKHKFRDVVIENVEVTNCRAEMVYNGGGSEKILIKNSEFHQSNSSTLSGSFDMELVNCIITDSANAAIESALQSDTVSPFTGKATPQNTIARDCIFMGLNPSGFMKDLPGKKYFGGWHVFNEEGTYQTCTDSSFSNFIYTAFAPWYEHRNGFRFNCSFNAPYGNYAGNIFSLDIYAKSDYRLAGGMSHVLWLADQIKIGHNMPNHQPFLYTAGIAPNDPWIWDQVMFTTSGNVKINVLWSDVWNQTGKLQQTIWSNWTRPSSLQLGAGYIQHIKQNYSDPNYINFLK